MSEVPLAELLLTCLRDRDTVKSMSLKYEPSSEPLHNSVKLLYLN